MTITQLNYIIAVDKFRSFVKAAEHCHVTQSTLSMQIKKLEGSLNVLIFNRERKPVQLTYIGEQIIKQAIVGLSEIERIKTIIKMGQQDLADHLRIGIIPTLSPYLLPLFLVSFTKKYPSISITTEELLSEEIIYKLYNNQLDVGILATPMENANLIEIPLFYESFLGYISNSHQLFRKQEIQPTDLGLDDFWLLEKGHCFRNQTLNICQKEEFNKSSSSIRFESGSLETVRRIVDSHYGYTLLPELATQGFNEEQKLRIRAFKPPVPVREVSMVIHQCFLKRYTMEVLKREIQKHLPSNIALQKSTHGKVINWKPLLNLSD